MYNKWIVSTKYDLVDCVAVILIWIILLLFLLLFLPQYLCVQHLRARAKFFCLLDLYGYKMNLWLVCRYSVWNAEQFLFILIYVQTREFALCWDLFHLRNDCVRAPPLNSTVFVWCLCTLCLWHLNLVVSSSEYPRSICVRQHFRHTSDRFETMSQRIRTDFPKIVEYSNRSWFSKLI